MIKIYCYLIKKMYSENISKDKKDKIKSKSSFENLKSDYFLQRIFDNMIKYKCLNIIKYNKKITKKIKFKD